MLHVEFFIYSTDLIGKVVDIEPVQKLPALFRDENAIFFNITDGRYFGRKSLIVQLNLLFKYNYLVFGSLIS